MLKVRDLMTTELITLSPDLSIRDAADLFAERHISGAPVLEGDRPIGILTSSDLLEFVANLDGGPGEVADGSNRNFLDDHTVEEAMTRGPLHSVSPAAAASVAAGMMREHGVHRVFVVDGTKLVGVISALDVTRALADGSLTHRVLVFPKRTRTD
jgi:CBS domain-containing protein